MAVLWSFLFCSFCSSRSVDVFVYSSFFIFLKAYVCVLCFLISFYFIVVTLVLVRVALFCLMTESS